MSGILDGAFNQWGKSYIEEQNKIIQKLEQRCDLLEKELHGAQVALGEVYQYMQIRKEINPNLEENIRNNNKRLEEIDEGLMMQAVKFRKMDAKLQNVSSGTVVSSDAGEGVSTESENEYSCIDYFDFENHFRGSREAIKSVQQQYVKYFEGRKNVLDLGCGRGEFLELMKENNIEAVGVECYTEFAEYCKMKDLNVVEEDAIAYLAKQEKVGGIFAGQLIEHLKFNQIVKLCELAYEKLEEGAYIILETPNPMSLAIYTHAFYMDPSHNKPIHPLTMEYFMRKVGFKDVEILFTDSSKYPVEIPALISDNIENIDAFNQSMKEVSQTLFGSQDYAIIGRR